MINVEWKTPNKMTKKLKSPFHHLIFMLPLFHQDYLLYISI